MTAVSWACAAALAALPLAATFAPAVAQEASSCTPVVPERPDEGAFLADEALREEFTNRRLEGCYPDGSPWAERTAAGGALYDDLQDGLLVGDWWVADGQICYFYPATMASRDDAACWEVIADNGDYYFFYPGTNILGGASYQSALVS